MVIDFADEVEDIDSEIACDRCNSKLTYIRFKDVVRVCRSCGYIEKLKEKEKNK